MLYQDLLGDDRIWDLRDLLTAMVPVFGFEGAFSQLLGISSTPQGLQVLVDDWIHPEYDESATLGLLDTFSSLILQNIETQSHNALLLHHSRGLVESIQRHNTQHVKTRPFIQFILARAAVEIEQVWAERAPDLPFPDGLPVFSNSGVNLPIFVPAKHLEKPGWGRVHAQTSPSLREAVNIALQAAKFTGDYAMQAMAWKLLIIQSEEPRPMMEGLARLQLDLQDDKEGFLTTCLSKYLTTLDRGDEDDLLKELNRLDEASDSAYLDWGFNASLLWARSIIQGHLESSTQGSTDEISGAIQDPGKVCRGEIHAYGARLSGRVVRFLDSAFKITAPRPLRVSFNGLRDPERAQATNWVVHAHQQESHSPRQDLVRHEDDTSTQATLLDAEAKRLDDDMRSAGHVERSLMHEYRFASDFDSDSDLDFMVRDQNSEVKNAHQTVRRTMDRQPHNVDESSVGDQWSAISGDAASKGGAKLPTINTRRSGMDVLRRRFSPSRLSFRPNTTYPRADSPSSHYYRQLERERKRAMERDRGREREREREIEREIEREREIEPERAGGKRRGIEEGREREGEIGRGRGREEGREIEMIRYTGRVVYQDAGKAEEANGSQEGKGSRKSTDKKTAAEPEPWQRRRHHGITKADAPRTSTMPGPYVGDRYAPRIVGNMSRTKTQDQHVPRPRVSPLWDKPAPEQGARNKNQANAEAGWESDVGQDSPVNGSGAGSGTKAVPPGKDGEEDKLSITTQGGGSRRGDGSKGIARA